MNGKRRRETDSARMSARSDDVWHDCMRAADSARTGRVNSSEVTVRRNMHPNTARVLKKSSVHTVPSVRGYSSS